jgi:hypothetical protein
MKMLIASVAVLGLTTIALAADDAEAPAEEEKVEDCSTIEDAEKKAECEAKKAAEAEAEGEGEKKGGKGKGLKKSENNKMEKFDEE